MAYRSLLLESGMPRIESSSATSLDHLDFHRMSSDISLLGAGLGPSIKWAGVTKFSGPIVSKYMFKINMFINICRFFFKIKD